jgi:hypothetical protein
LLQNIPLTRNSTTLPTLETLQKIVNCERLEQGDQGTISATPGET